MIASGGTVVLIGLSPAGETATIDLPALFRRRARILVSHGGDHLPREDFPRLAQWALDGSLDLASMVTRTAGLGDWSEAFDAMQDGHVIRTVLTPVGSLRGSPRHARGGRVPAGGSRVHRARTCPRAPQRAELAASRTTTVSGAAGSARPATPA